MSNPSGADAQILKAIGIAAVAHQGQIDRGGEPYIKHVLRVAAAMNTATEICAAVLHDVLEDNPVVKREDLEREGFGADVVDAVVAISKIPGEPYLAYLNRVKANGIARRVKLADLRDNADLARLLHADHEDLRRTAKYLAAITYLQEA